MLTPQQEDLVVESLFDVYANRVKKWWNARGYREMKKHSNITAMTSFWDEEWKHLTLKQKCIIAALVRKGKI